jgi:hypothetical protein
MTGTTMQGMMMVPVILGPLTNARREVARAEQPVKLIPRPAIASGAPTVGRGSRTQTRPQGSEKPKSSGTEVRATSDQTRQRQAASTLHPESRFRRCRSQ